MAKKRTRDLSKGVKGNVEERRRKANTKGYLILPDGFEKFKEEPDSKIKLDILPYEVTGENHPDRNDEDGIALPGDIWYKRPFKVHFIKVPGNKTAGLICPKGTFNKPCPICDAISNGEVDKDDIQSVRAKSRILYAVIPIGHKDYDEEIHIWDISYHNFQAQLDEDVEEEPEDENDDYGRFPNLEGGYTLKIRFSSAKNPQGKAYPVASRVDFMNRKEDYDESIIDEVPKLDEVFDVKSYDELNALFWGEEPEEDNDDDEEKEEKEEPVAKRKKKTVSSKKEEPKDDDDEDEEQEQKKTTASRKKKTVNKEENKQEKTQPKSRRKKTTSKKQETEEGEEEEEKPECPHDPELKFGKDFDSDERCDDCSLWNECRDEYEENYKKG